MRFNIFGGEFQTWIFVRLDHGRCNVDHRNKKKTFKLFLGLIYFKS